LECERFDALRRGFVVRIFGSPHGLVGAPDRSRLAVAGGNAGDPRSNWR
jgi:hypothetical protein